ncbi:MAG: exodeoxyribonuclease VII small subunit [Erysipelothrix sp.]|nr:exodeoxyribonuclease VII small subunit [Erysipelothrix sp.]
MSEKFNFEEAMKRLNVISEQLERDDVPLDEAMMLFEEGLELSKKCQLVLDDYEVRVNELVNKHKEVKND